MGHRRVKRFLIAKLFDVTPIIQDIGVSFEDNLDELNTQEAEEIYQEIARMYLIIITNNN